jgi:hypothetical protein
MLFESSAILVGDAVVGKSSLSLFFLLYSAPAALTPADDFLLFPLNGIKGSLTPLATLFLIPSLSFLCKGLFKSVAALFLED